MIKRILLMSLSIIILMPLSSCTWNRVAVLASNDYEWILPKGSVLVRPPDCEIVKNGAADKVILDVDGVAISYTKLRELKKLEGR